MHSVPSLTPGSINAITGLDSRPVFFLTLNNMQQIVVKGEPMTSLTNADAEVSIKWGSKMMKNVNNALVNTKIMTDPEYQVFRKFATVSFHPTSRQQHYLKQQYRWVKMPMVRGLSDGDAWGDDNKVSEPKLKAALKQFMNGDVWKELGKVVAVDIFIGNNDRFYIDNAMGTVQWGNQGNIMFLEGGSTSVIGLDTFDPSGAEDEGGRSNLGTGKGVEKNFDILKKTPDRTTFSQKCTAAVAVELARFMNKTGQTVLTLAVQGGGGGIVRVRKDSLEELLLPFAVPFAEGMVEGTNELKTYLTQKKRQYGQSGGWVSARPGQRMVMGGNRSQKRLPQGVLQRMQMMGWS